MSNLKTRWTDNVNYDCPLSEYPRPQLVRNDWQCLNGKFEFTITGMTDDIPQDFDGEIVVPFAPECYLSGIERTIEPDDYLWYRKKFILDDCFEGKRCILHFEAVDWRCMVFFNGKPVGTHQGGYLPFSFDVTEYLNEGYNELVVRVNDPTETNWQDRGKQVRKSVGFWYTATSGIWQSVWLEPVNEKHIENIRLTPDIDASAIRIETELKYAENTQLRAIIKKDDSIVFAGTISPDETVKLKDIRLWSPEDPFLYDIVIALCDENEKILDVVSSYFGMRKFSIGYDDKAIPRLYLNNKPYFQTGLLDQGYWPDGGMTPACDEAMVFDIKEMKNLGFNMLRKHIKIEPRRWYYHCDKEGILVWQDMPSGDHGSYIWDHHVYNGGKDNERTPESKANYYREWKEIMDLCISNPSVVVWVPFNEAWGQFETEKAAEWTKTYDPSRLVNPASGGNHRPCGDILDLHNYPAPDMFLFDPKRVNVLGEYGGIGLPVENHLWWNKRNWGYVQFKNSDEVTAEYVKYANILKDYVKRGFSAAVYTQTTDVEGEVNGLMTYDRKVIKIDEAAVKKANQSVINELK